MHWFGMPHLLVPNGEFALGFLVVLREGLQFLDGLILQNGGEEFHVLFRVLVTGLYSYQQFDHTCYLARETRVDFGVARQRSQRFVQGCVHFCRGPFEKSTTTLTKLAMTELDYLYMPTSNEQCIPRKNHSFIAILHKVTDAILRVTRRV